MSPLAIQTKNPLTDKIKRVGLRILIFIIKKTPSAVHGILAWILSWILSVTLKRERSIAISQLNFALPEHNAFNIYRESLYGAILTVIECFRINDLLKMMNQNTSHDDPIDSIAITKEKSNNTSEIGCVKIFGPDEFVGNRMLSNILSGKKDKTPEYNQGAVCLGAHLGNFELMAASFAKQGYPLTVIARKANNLILQEVIEKVRRDYGVEMLWREDSATSKHLIGAIKNNRFICALIDQDIALENAFAPFFGMPASHPVAPIKIAVRFKKPVYTFFTRRVCLGFHKVFINRIQWEDVLENPEIFILTEYSRLLEEFIRSYPDQWVWWHRRWRRQEGVDYEKYPDKLPTTKNYVSWIKSMTQNNVQESKTC
ncbi:MAG TPA: lysophospholipid acyltransferase family protein [Oligoflexia bacterium]|nr:lysophospholipid acyltransferase family protein [Oligoflexia bacterium]HMP47652.1 lysophospholipid acyltransferase family protein [Oligoflexia bacterium]